MEQKLNEQIKVGFFVFMGLVITMFIIFMLGREKKLFESHFRLNAYFNDISGLRTGAPVYLAGISVGFVDSIQFNKELKDQKVKVVLRISENYQQRIREDSMASIVTQGLLGDKMIFVSVGSHEKNQLKDGDDIKAEMVKSFYEYFDRAGKLMDTFESVGNNLNKLLEGDEGEKHKKSFAGIMKSLDNIMAKIDRGEGFAGALVNDPDGKQLVKNMNQLVNNFSGVLGGHGPGTSVALRQTLFNLSDASYDLKILLDRIEKGDGTIGGLVKDPTVYYELRTLLGKANRNKIVRAVIRGTLDTNDKNLNE